MKTARPLGFLFTTALALVAVVPSGLSAQKGLELGARAGVSVAGASLDVSETLDKSNRTGVAAGLFLNYDHGLLGFQVAGQYSQKGVELDFGDNVIDYKFGYFEIPAVLKLGVPLGIIKPSVFGGAGVGFSTNCDVDGQDCGDLFKSTDTFGIAGADVAIYLGSISLWADGRYHFGLTDISKTSDVVGDLKNRNWTLQAGLGFKLGG